MIADLPRIRQLARKAARRALPALPWPVMPVILMYHRIGDVTFNPWGVVVSQERFAAQMECVARNRTVLQLAEFARLHGERSLPPKAIAVTFDDGYSSVATLAAPILERLGIPATIFIPAQLIDRGEEFWWDELERVTIGFTGTRLTFDDEVFELGPPVDDDKAWAPGAQPRTPRQLMFWRIWSNVRQKPRQHIDGALGQLREQTEGFTTERRAERLMTRGEARALNSPTLKIGSHALTHSSLPHLTSHEKLSEIRDSVEVCEAITGERPRTFAYPYGEFDDESEALVTQSGFYCACTTEERGVYSAARKTALPRLGVGNWPPEQFDRLLFEL